ncbi:Mu transposase C-terminal domain-containing protein [Petroclostridium sp. X23]|uniref:Mu transposase C-terminal domain-containing protein n=1 Tax=Petroclostridium sp. X23 TaxID=3045146 RepID=UPI0024ADD38D|nr:Mu transposase C-terminal domain-containing protein [Petroclostridium sp. X23]WHH60979.1 Mu transposase C-terminal domain-containing protein [Petroclostridium sp. X23]
MQDILAINSVIQWDPIDGNTDMKLERVLWVNPVDKLVIVIEINNPKALPKERSFVEIETLVQECTIRIINFHYKDKLITNDDLLPEKYKQIRDKNWKIIKDCVIRVPDIYYEKTRGKLIKQAFEKYQTSKKYIYLYLRKYWQGGLSKNCLLPDYEHCGNKGKEKPTEGTKRGRERKRDDNKKTGINITLKDRMEFKKAIENFYKSTEKRPLLHVYEKMIFSQYILGYKLCDGVEVPILKPFDSLPTFEQFVYWVKKDTDIQAIIAAREGEKGYALRHREVLGDSTVQAFGPGSRFQIDSTIASVYMVNSLDRTKVIKRAVIYVLIDVFSRLIAGLYIGLEGPSWVGAMMALENAARNKVEYCKEYGINIQQKDWPCEYLPELITADRFEFLSDNANNLIDTLGVDVEILPPYRADWKGIVECVFRRLDLGVLLWLPGAVKKKYRERGEKDYRLGAALTLKELTTVVIRCVLFYNNVHRMKWYKKNEFLISDRIKPIPLELWNWGMKNRTGKLKKYHEDIIKLNLLPSNSATVTFRGIKLGKYFYTCETAKRDHWFQKARSNNSWKIPISYDPRNMKYAYIRLDNGRDYEKCYLLESSYMYKNAYLEEVDEYVNNEKKNAYFDEYTELQKKAELDALNTDTINTGISNTEAAKQEKSISGRKTIKGIREATADERQRLAKEEAFELPDTSNILSDDLENEDDYLAPKSYIRYEEENP